MQGPQRSHRAFIPSELFISSSPPPTPVAAAALWECAAWSCGTSKPVKAVFY